jgi:hypothetical protein
MSANIKVVIADASDVKHDHNSFKELMPEVYEFSRMISRKHIQPVMMHIIFLIMQMYKLPNKTN